MSLNMSNRAEAGEYELITGRVQISSDDAANVRATRELLDLDEIVDRRNEIAELRAAHFRLAVYTEDSPVDQISDATATCGVSTSNDGYPLESLGNDDLANTPVITDSHDPVTPVMQAQAFAGESQIEGGTQAGVGSGDSHVFDEFQFDGDTELIPNVTFDARDEINARIVVDVSKTRGALNSFITSLNYQMSFRLRSA